MANLSGPCFPTIAKLSRWEMDRGRCCQLTPKQGCQIFLGTLYQNQENIPNYHEIYQMATKIPNGRKIEQSAIKYTRPYKSWDFGFENILPGNPASEDFPWGQDPLFEPLFF
jgi:hypothetical protein